MLLVALPGLLLVSGSAGWPWVLAHALGLAWLMSRWLREYRRGISAPGWDLLDGAALLILCLPDDGFPAAGLFYAATYWRAVTASTPRAVASICGISVLFGAVVVFSDGMSPQMAIGPGVGMAASSLLLHLVVAITSRHEQQIRRQGAFVDAVLRNLDTGVVACDSTGAVTVVNDAARFLHAVPVETTTPGQIASRYQLHGPDGVTLLEPHEVPMNRALAGEHVRNQEVVMVRDGQRRTVVVERAPTVRRER